MRGFIDERLSAFLYDYAVRLAASGSFLRFDSQVPNILSCYGDPFMEALLERQIPTVASLANVAVVPTYSYFRVYRRGDVLPKHTDRPACEISVSLSLGRDGDACWPIWIEKDGRAVPIYLDPGDALMYRGIEIPHWRDQHEGDKAAQVFLHYVDRDGPHRDWIYDKRSGLATSPLARALVARSGG
ncbi:MAG TPA: hypothetical protein VHH90_01165 [Polyangia bacterium]|nr:hypothetical protein [Polyangia bacterium]